MAEPRREPSTLSSSGRPADPERRFDASRAAVLFAWSGWWSSLDLRLRFNACELRVTEEAVAAEPAAATAGSEPAAPGFALHLEVCRGRWRHPSTPLAHRTGDPPCHTNRGRGADGTARGCRRWRGTPTPRP